MDTEERLEQLESKLDRLLEMFKGANITPSRKWYSTAEFAGVTGLSQQVVSRYCQQGRLKGIRSEARRGPRKEWRIPVEEVNRYKEQGPRVSRSRS
jgi:hypothetical protein